MGHACILLQIPDIRDKWLLNDTPGPIAELLENRLLRMKIGREEVALAQIRRHQDRQTLVYQNIIFPIQDLHTIIHSLAEARRLFRHLTGIPEFTVSDLADNCNTTRPGDSRNKDITYRGHQWLFSQLCGSPESAEAFLGQDAHGG